MEKSNTSMRLKQIMKDRNLKQADILRLCEPYCKKYGVRLAKNDLSQYVSGKVEPKQDKLSILGMASNVSEPWLMGYDPVGRTSIKPLETLDSSVFSRGFDYSNVLSFSGLLVKFSVNERF